MYNVIILPDLTKNNPLEYILIIAQLYNIYGQVMCIDSYRQNEKRRNKNDKINCDHDTDNYDSNK